MVAISYFSLCVCVKKNEKKWKGDCRIEYDLGGIKNNTNLIVKDRAEGMDYERLEKNFGEYGEKQSGKANRGDAGRGAKDPVSTSIIKAVNKAIDIPIIVGGGINTPDIAKSAVDAGASMIVTGTVIEKDPGHIKNFTDAIHDGLT